MAEPGTYIKLYRSILDWRWFTDANTFRVFIYLLIKANIVDRDFQNIVIHRGELATSYGSIALALGISENSVRTAISHLKSTGEITARIYSKFQVITIVCFDKYQSTLTGNRTPSSQASNTQSTGNSHQSKKLKTLESYDSNKECKKLAPSENRSEPEQPPFICLLLNDKSSFPVFETDIESWNELYPAVDVKQELRKMAGWLDANPAKRKTRAGIKRFINTWLSREQDRGGSKKAISSFNYPSGPVEGSL